MLFFLFDAPADNGSYDFNYNLTFCWTSLLAVGPIRVGISVILVCVRRCTPGIGVDGRAHLRPGAPEVLYPVVPKGEHAWISHFSLAHL